MCIGVTANGIGSGQGSHVSVTAHLMKGDYDDNLVWPIQGRVTFELLNQLQDSHHNRSYIDYQTVKDEKCMQRVIQGDRANLGGGTARFIAYDQLGFDAENNCQYLKDDCLYFGVSVETPSSKPWLFPQ